MRALLDVNVLVALLDADHVHHDRAKRWLLERRTGGWASCALTQNGCVRVMSSASYPNPVPPSEVVERLAGATAHGSHAFWPADVSLLDETVADRTRILGPRQVSDLYLLALAVHRQGIFATFDRSVPISAIRGAQDRHLAVI